MLPEDHLWTSQVWLGSMALLKRAPDSSQRPVGVRSYRPERCSFALFFLLQQPLPRSSPLGCAPRALGLALLSVLFISLHSVIYSNRSLSQQLLFESAVRFP